MWTNPPATPSNARPSEHGSCSRRTSPRRLEGDFDVHRDGVVAAKAGGHLSACQALQLGRIVAATEHKRAAGMSAADAARDYLRDAAFTRQGSRRLSKNAQAPTTGSSTNHGKKGRAMVPFGFFASSGSDRPRHAGGVVAMMKESVQCAILEIHDAMAEAIRTGTPYETRLPPPPVRGA